MQKNVKQKRGLYHAVVKDLAMQILSGRIKPGARIPPEPDLVERYQVSRTVIRDALRILTTKGFIEARPRIGTIIREVGAWNFLDRDVVEWAIGEDGMDGFLGDFMQARAAMEPQIVAVAAEQANLADVHSIAAAYDKMVAAFETGDIPKYRKSDLEFHLAILAATNNLVLQHFGGLFQAALNTSFVLSTRSGMCSHASLLLHGEVLAGIRGRDPSRAQEALYGLLKVHRQGLAGKMRLKKTIDRKAI